MSENTQPSQLKVKLTTYKTPKDVWFRSHILLPLLILGGFFTLYLALMVNLYALIGFIAIIILFILRPGSDIYQMRHLSLKERIILTLRGLGQIILVFGGIIFVYFVIYLTESYFLAVILLVLSLILIDRLETYRIAQKASRWNKLTSNSNQQ